LGEAYFSLHDFGRRLLLQGMFLGLVMGVGGMVLPLLTRGESSRDSDATARSRLILAGHTVAALVLAASFWIETSVSQVGGLALRAALTLLVLFVSGRIYRPPALPGWHRRLVWLAAGVIPGGYCLADPSPPRGQC